MKRILIIVVLLILSPTISFAQHWEERFENGISSAHPYANDATNATLEQISSETGGGHCVRATIPGKSKLEGFYVSATGLTGARVTRVSAKVRGKGVLWLCLDSNNGWLYSESTTKLTSSWQIITLSKSLAASDASLGIYFLTMDKQSGAVFEVDDITADQTQAPSTYDTNVNPWRLEAEDYSTTGIQATADNSALGGKAVVCNAYSRFEGIPFPRTNRVASIYVRIKPGSEKEAYRLYTVFPGQKQIIASINPTKSGAWQWLRFPNVSSGEVGDTFNLEYAPDSSITQDTAYIDSVVVSTQDNLTDSNLDNSPLLLPERPFTTVAKCPEPPVIDGKGDDLCWKNTVACTDFLRVNSESRADGQTSVRLCYDDKNLYALFVCNEPILNPVLQRVHEFVANVKERDSGVWQDDWVAMILRPDITANDVYDFFANSLGTLNDAHCQYPDIWGTRDTKWNMNARIAAIKGNGEWSLEIAIPFADLSQQPKVGDDWQVAIGRGAIARGENSSWNLSVKGLHDPRELGILRFGGTLGNVELHAADSLEPGKNTLKVSLSSTSENSMGEYVFTSINGQNSTKHSLSFTIPGESKDSRTPFEVQESGDVKIAYGILDAATCQPVYLTPNLSRPVTSSLSTVSIKCEGPYELYLNGNSMAKGLKADNDAIKVSLRKGINLFAIKLDKGTAAINISAPGMEESKLNWKIAPAGIKEPFSPDTDDSSWKTAATSGLMVGESGSEVVLRHTLLVDKTRIYPTPVPAWYICRGSTQQLIVVADGVANRTLNGWEIFIAVPVGFKIIGCSGYYTGRYDLTTVGAENIDGRKMVVYKVSSETPITTGAYDQLLRVPVFVKCTETVKADKTSILYWTSANDGTISEVRHAIPVQILPGLNGRQPKKLVWQMWGMFWEMTNHIMRDQVAKSAQIAGFNNFATGTVEAKSVLDKYAMQNTVQVCFEEWSLNFKSYLKDHPQDCLVMPDAKQSERWVCTSLLLEKSNKALANALNRVLKECKTGNVIYDFEVPPFDGPHSCYCERCLPKFRKYAGLSADIQLNGQTIKDKYSAQWIDFMAYVDAEVLAKMRNIIRSASPIMKFWIYSGYQNTDNPRMYGINWDYIGKLKSCDVASMGYGRPVTDIPATIAVLKGIPAVFGSLLTPYLVSDTSPSLQISRAEMLRRVLDSTGGILVFERDSVDGRTWYASAETSRLVATYEDAFLHGKRSKLGSQDESAVQLLTSSKSVLLCIMNETNKQAEYNIRLPGKTGKWKEFYTGRTVRSGETLKASLQSGEIAVYVQDK